MDINGILEAAKQKLEDIKDVKTERGAANLYICSGLL